MNEAQLVFEPNAGADTLTLWLGAGAALLAAAGLIWTLRSRQIDRNRRLVVAMLLFFVALLGAGTAIFSAWSKQKLAPVYFYAQELESPYGRVAYSDITDAYITTDKAVQPVFTYQNRDQLLVIESRQQVHVLSEQNYPIRKIFEQLKARMP